MNNIFKRLEKMANSTNSCKAITAVNHYSNLKSRDFSKISAEELADIISFEDKILTQMGY
jgi:hypothetical protein